jgi:hypothetical protein
VIGFGRRGLVGDDGVAEEQQGTCALLWVVTARPEVAHGHLAM